MPFWRTYYHLVWATKNREPWITPDIEPRLYAYIVHKAAELGVFVYVINGWTDHTHLIVAIPPHVSVADLVKHLKGASSHDLNQQGLAVHFGWQRGYGVLTLGQRQKPDAEAYVSNQKEHHRLDTAIAWLERYSEFDEGPDDLPSSPSLQPVPALREPSPIYDYSEFDEGPDDLPSSPASQPAPALRESSPTYDCSEFDEGPDDLPSSPASQPAPALRESSPTYDTLDEPAF